MRSVIIENFETGLVGISEVEDARLPQNDEITVRVMAAGLNRGDLLQARGKYPPPKGYAVERPGLEFAGEVSLTGDGVVNLSAGDRVMGLATGEAQAEFVTVPAKHVVKIPERFSFIEAAAIPEAFITAHDALITQAALTGGETLLIHAVASGVGLAALRLGKAFGANIAGTSRSAAKLEKCIALGLDHAFHTGGKNSFTDELMAATGGNGANVILDLVGANYLNENLMTLASKGRLMMVGLTGGRKAELDMGIVLQKRLTLKGTVLRSRSTEEKTAAVRAFNEDVMPLFEQGLLSPDIDRVFNFSEAAKAYEYLASDQSFGKVVLKW